MTLAIRVTGLKEGEKDRYLFATSPVRFGRDRANDLKLDVDRISRFHAVIDFDGDTVHYKDLASTNGTSLNGQRLPPNQPIRVKPRDKIEIGPITLFLEPSSEAAAPPPADASIGTLVDNDWNNKVKATQAAIEELAPFYEKYQRERQALAQRLEGALKGKPSLQQSMITAACEERFAGFKEEPVYRRLKQSLHLADADVDPDVDAAGHARDATPVGSAGELARALGLKDPTRPDRLFTALAEVLPAFCEAFVELRKGLAQFSNEVAVDVFDAATPLHEADTGRALLEYLLAGPSNGPNSGTSRARELSQAFSDMMIHQVGLIAGVMDGVRGLLQRLSPGAIRQTLVKRPEAVGPLKVGSGLGPLSALAAWRRFAETHKTMIDDEQALSQVLFGRDFARGYAASRSQKKASPPPSALARTRLALEEEELPAKRAKRR